MDYYCANCGEWLAEFGVKPDEYVSSRGDVCCCRDCQRDAENAAWEAEAYYYGTLDYND